MSTNTNNTAGTTTTANPMADFAKSMIAAQKEVQKDKDWKKSELSKLEKEMQKELDVVRNACKVAVEAVTEPFDAEIEAIKAKYKELMNPHRLVNADKAEEVANKAADKIGDAIEVPVTAILGFKDRIVSRFKKQL